MRTIEELKSKALATGRNHWGFHVCSMCGYQCGYRWNAVKLDELIYDSGCHCVSWKDIQPRTWKDLANNYNQEHPEAFERHERTWGFINEGVNSDTNTTR